MSKRKGLLQKLLFLTSMFFMLFLLQRILADDKYKAPVPSGPDIKTIAVGKIATIPYADHVSVFPTNGDLVKGREAYYFTSAHEGQYLFTLITQRGALVTGELLTLIVGKVNEQPNVLKDLSRQTKQDLDLDSNSEVAKWFKNYSQKILDKNLRSDEIGKTTTEQAKTWPNDWKKWYNKMVPVITAAANDRPIVTSEHWALAYKEIWEGIK